MTLQVYGGPTVDPQCLTVLAAAVRDHERVRFAYTARDRAGTRREAEPHSLVNAGRRWYLVAWDCGRKDWRTFRVDRIEQGRQLPASASRRASCPRPTRPRYVQQSLQSYTARYEARVTVARARRPNSQNRRWLGERHGARRRTAARSAPATTTWTGWRCGSR